jgi:tetratricopeptide (TPR) repeat protein
LALFEEAIAQARAIGFRAAEAALLNNLGEARLMLEETSAARKIVLQALKIAEETGEKRVLFDITRNLGKIDLAEGDKESALERLGEADEIAMDLDSPALRAMAKRSLGDVYSHFLLTEADEDKAAATAEMYFREAIDIFRDLGNESELARTLLAFGQFLQGRGEDFRATQYLDTAKEISDRLHIVISELPSIPGVT